MSSHLRIKVRDSKMAQGASHQQFSHCNSIWFTWGGLFKHRPLEPTPRVSDSVGPGQGPVIYMSSKFPGDTDAAQLGTTLGDPAPCVIWPHHLSDSSSCCSSPTRSVPFKLATLLATRPGLPHFGAFNARCSNSLGVSPSSLSRPS